MAGSVSADRLEAALASIVRRIEARVDDVADEMVERYQAEIVDYATLDPPALQDVREVSIENLRALLANLERGELMSPEQLERTRRAAARRVHQGIGLTSLLHAFRLWGRMVWEAVLGSARTERRSEREAALHLAGRIIHHIDLISVAVTEAYVTEAQGLWSDRELTRRDLLDALLSGGADVGRLRHDATSLRLTLHDSYVVVVVRLAATTDEAPAPLQLQATLRHGVELVKRSLHPEEGSLLVGVRQARSSPCSRRPGRREPSC